MDLKEEFIGSVVGNYITMKTENESVKCENFELENGTRIKEEMIENEDIKVDIVTEENTILDIKCKYDNFIIYKDDIKPDILTEENEILKIKGKFDNFTSYSSEPTSHGKKFGENQNMEQDYGNHDRHARKTVRMTIAERTEAVELLKSGYSMREVATRMEVSSTAIFKLRIKFLHHQTVKNLPRGSRVRSSTEQQDIALADEVRRNPDSAYQVSMAACNFPASISTARRRIREARRRRRAAADTVSENRK